MSHAMHHVCMFPVAGLILESKLVPLAMLKVAL